MVKLDRYQTSLKKIYVLYSMKSNKYQSSTKYNFRCYVSSIRIVSLIWLTAKKTNNCFPPFPFQETFQDETQRFVAKNKGYSTMVIKLNIRERSIKDRKRKLDFSSNKNTLSSIRWKEKYILHQMCNIHIPYW